MSSSLTKVRSGGLKIAERRGAMLGTDASTRIDAVQLRQVGPEQTSTEDSSMS
jgi:hypothetical protein